MFSMSHYEFSSDLLRQRFHENMHRCRGLIIALLKNSLDDELRQDILRSVVVFLHATMEDLMRTVLIQMYRNNPKPLLTHRLADMHKFGEFWDVITDCGPTITVDQIILREIQYTLRDVSFGNTNILAKDLERMNFRTEMFSEHFAMLSEMMLRRHTIVHRADRAGHMSSEPSEIKVEQVEEWMINVDRFGSKLIGAFEVAWISDI
jgi:hypothetical protein